MTIRELLDKYGYTYTRRDCSLIGHSVKRATLNTGKRTYEYVGEGSYFVVDYEHEYYDIIRKVISDFFTEKAERVSKDEARRKEIAELKEAKMQAHLLRMQQKMPKVLPNVSQERVKRPRIAK